MRLFFLLLLILLLNLFVNALVQKDLPTQTLELHSERVRHNAGVLCCSRSGQRFAEELQGRQPEGLCDTSLSRSTPTRWSC